VIGSAGLSPEARAVVDAYVRDGRVELATGRSSIVGIVGVGVGFLVFGGICLGVAPDAGPAAAALTPIWLSALGMFAWALRLAVPRVRVVVDREGVVVRRRPPVPWAAIAAIRVGTARSEGTYHYVVLETLAADGRPEPVRLPLLLSPQAAHLREALVVLLAEAREVRRSAD
jgi:hypothetical protein